MLPSLYLLWPAHQHVALVVLLQRAVLERVVPLDAPPQRRRQPLVLRVPGQGEGEGQGYGSV